MPEFLGEESDIIPEVHKNIETYLTDEKENEQMKKPFTLKIVVEKPCYLCGEIVHILKAPAILSMGQIKHPFCRRCFKAMNLFRKSEKKLYK